LFPVLLTEIFYERNLIWREWIKLSEGDLNQYIPTNSQGSTSSNTIGGKKKYDEGKESEINVKSDLGDFFSIHACAGLSRELLSAGPAGICISITPVPPAFTGDALGLHSMTF